MLCFVRAFRFKFRTSSYGSDGTARLAARFHQETAAARDHNNHNRV